MENSLEQARALIKAKRYDEARRLLKTINHPTAKQWLETIDALSPASGGSSVARSDKRNDVADAAQARLARASELIKQRQYDEARRILEAMDHPKAREWLGRLDNMQQPSAAAASAASVSSPAPARPYNLSKPLPEIETQKPVKAGRKFSTIDLMIALVVVVLVVIVAFVAMRATGVANNTNYSNIATIVIMGVVVIGLRIGLRGTFFASNFGFRILIMGGALLAFTVMSFINSQVRVPFQDEALTLQYPGTWTAQDLNEDDDCLNDPIWRRCLLVLVNYTQGKRVWAVLKEDTYDDATTLAEADDNHWSYMIKQDGTQLDKQWDTTIDGQPASVRQYTFQDTSSDLYWYSVRLFVMRDSHHLIRLSLISEKPEIINNLWGEIEGMYKSIQLKAV